jgi:hypothetical protein
MAHILEHGQSGAQVFAGGADAAGPHPQQAAV